MTSRVAALDAAYVNGGACGSGSDGAPGAATLVTVAISRPRPAVT